MDSDQLGATATRAIYTCVMTTARRDITALKELHNQRFDFIERQLAILDKLGDRLIVLEAKPLGASETREQGLDQRTDLRGNVALVVSAVSLLLTLILTVVTTVHLTGH